ncbi:TonB-dependent receptor, partial [Tepidimonas sp.]|uniref:TonB-dependent receptor n=1 Tax=Tepidimonas sp. TaxID=2002775 RepID=UPI002FE23330
MQAIDWVTPAPSIHSCCKLVSFMFILALRYGVNDTTRSSPPFDVVPSATPQSSDPMDANPVIRLAMPIANTTPNLPVPSLSGQPFMLSFGTPPTAARCADASADVPPTTHRATPGASLPLGAMLLAASLQAVAQTVGTAGTLDTVTVTGQSEPAEIRSKSTLKPATTRLGKGEQSLRDIPQNVTVMTERLLDDRNLDDFREVLKTTAGVTFQAGETGEEDVRLRGFSLGQAGDIFRDGMREAQLITRDTFATERVEVMKGSASMLFGKGSTGGVVNQVTKQPFLMDRYEAELTLGNGNHRRVQADLNKQLDSNSAVRLNAMVQRADNWGAQDDRQGLAASWRTGIGERNEFQVDLYHLKTDQRPIYNHPWLLTGSSGQPQTIVPTLPAKNFYG